MCVCVTCVSCDDAYENSNVDNMDYLSLLSEQTIYLTNQLSMPMTIWLETIKKKYIGVQPISIWRFNDKIADMESCATDLCFAHILNGGVQCASIVRPVFERTHLNVNDTLRNAHTDGGHSVTFIRQSSNTSSIHIFFFEALRVRRSLANQLNYNIFFPNSNRFVSFAYNKFHKKILHLSNGTLLLNCVPINILLRNDDDKVERKNFENIATTNIYRCVCEVRSLT